MDAELPVTRGGKGWSRRWVMVQRKELGDRGMERKPGEGGETGKGIE